MKIERKFRVEMHEDFGTLGMRPCWMRNADPYTGMAVAHDMLEHLPGDDGGAEAEFMARGGTLWIRADNGYWSRTGNVNPPGAHLAADLPDIMERVRSGGQTLRDPGRTQALESVEYHIDEAFHHVRLELADREMPPLTDEDKRRIRGWMRKGYRRTAKRFKGIPSYKVCETFIKIEKAADNFLISEGKEAEGSDVTVRADLFREVAVVDYDCYMAENS